MGLVQGQAKANYRIEPSICSCLEPTSPKQLPYPRHLFWCVFSCTNLQRANVSQTFGELDDGVVAHVEGAQATQRAERGRKLTQGIPYKHTDIYTSIYPSALSHTGGV